LAACSAALALLAATFLICPELRAAPSDRAVIVVLHTDATELHPDELRAAVAREVEAPALAASDAAGRPVRGTLTVTWRPAKELAVTWSEPPRGAITRVVESPPDAKEATLTASLLAAHLIRDEELVPDADVPPPPLPPPPAPAPVPHPEKKLPATAALFYPLSTHYGAPEPTTHLAFNAAYDRVGRVEGLAVGFVNHATRSLLGAQLALGANLVGGPVEGLQVAPALNLAGGGLAGVQASFFFNRAGDVSSGGQVALLGMNLAPRGIDGIEVAPANVAGDVRGAQIGFLNVGAEVRGVQLGLINVADDADVPIGVVSVTKTGGVHPLAWSSNTTYANAGMKFATKHTYTIASFGAHGEVDAAGHGHMLYGPGFTAGGHTPIGHAGFYCDFDLGITWLLGGALQEVRPPAGQPQLPPYLVAQDLVLSKLRIMGGYAFTDHASLFAGVGTTLTTRFFADRRDPRFSLGPEVFAGVQF
jgi:hypothetical protein